MRFIYTFNKEIANELKEKGLNSLGEVDINNQKAFVFENRKDVFLNKYAKNELLLTNKLMF